MESNTNGNRISAAQAAFFIRNRDQFHQRLKELGYNMPSVHSNFCTLEWMWGV